MFNIKYLGFVALTACSSYSLAADFSFDRPGLGLGTAITPVGQVAWEQSLPAVKYSENTANGQKVKQVQVQGDMLLRTGLAEGLELRLGWDGPMWQKTKVGSRSVETEGLGDVSVGLKKAIDLDDDQLSLAVVAEAIIATGNDAFTNQDDIYRLSSVVAYQYEPQLQTSLTMQYEIQDGEWRATAIPAISYHIAGAWSGFSELYYSKAESLEHEYGLVTGVAYQLNPRTQLDASVGVDLDGKNKSYQGGLGVAFLF